MAGAPGGAGGPGPSVSAGRRPAREEMTVERLRAAQPEQPYTRQLLQASLGYDRRTAEALVTFD